MGGSNTLRSTPLAHHNQNRGRVLVSKGFMMHNWHPGMISPIGQNTKSIEVRPNFETFDSILAKNQ